MNISVLVLTLNEERNIVDCLTSLSWSDDVVVLDSISSDRTVQIAAKHNARIYQRAFDTYSGQRNYGLTTIAFKNTWVLMLDADERVPPDLKLEMLHAVQNADDQTTLFMMRRRDHLFGRWIRRSSGYPTWFGRLGRLGRMWVDRPINEEYRTDGKASQLNCHIDHYPFNKGFSEWLTKHDRYSTMEAELQGNGHGSWPSFSHLCSANSLVRRKALKSLAYRVPGRPLAVFLVLYLVRGGLLEGRAGLTFCLLRSWYEFMIDCKTREMARRSQGKPV